MAAYMLVRSGLKVDDASFVGTGVTSTAVAAARRAEIDAIVSSDPMISLMQREGLVNVVADTRTPEGTQAVYGGPYPGGVVYTSPDFIAKNPHTVQALVSAFVRALKWMSVHSVEDVAKTVPEEYALGNREVYVTALAASRAMSLRSRRGRDRLSGAQRVRSFGCARDGRSIQDLHWHLRGEGACGELASVNALGFRFRDFCSRMSSLQSYRGRR